jgi:hypothetical protein
MSNINLIFQYVSILTDIDAKRLYESCYKFQFLP